MSEASKKLARIIATCPSKNREWPEGAERAKVVDAAPMRLLVHFVTESGYLVKETLFKPPGQNCLDLMRATCTWLDYEGARGRALSAGEVVADLNIAPLGQLPPSPFNVEGYEALADVLLRAYDQSARGKGRERHATGLPFHEQPIVRGGKDYGPGGPLFQVGKKSREAFGMLQRGERDAAVHELLGAIVYAAGAIVAIEGEGE